MKKHTLASIILGVSGLVGIGAVLSPIDKDYKVAIGCAALLIPMGYAMKEDLESSRRRCIYEIDDSEEDLSPEELLERNKEAFRKDFEALEKDKEAWKKDKEALEKDAEALRGDWNRVLGRDIERLDGGLSDSTGIF